MDGSYSWSLKGVTTFIGLLSESKVGEDERQLPCDTKE